MCVCVCVCVSICACMHDVCVCGDSGGEAAVDEDRQDKEGKQKMVEIKPRGQKSPLIQLNF